LDCYGVKLVPKTSYLDELVGKRQQLCRRYPGILGGLRFMTKSNFARAIPAGRLAWHP
jgi:hypothetical protein